jgi:hypothetical protein
MVDHAAMRKFWLTIAALLVAAAPAWALDARLKAGLLKLDPDTRLEQRCDAEALDRIGHDKNPYKPDRVVAYAIKTPTLQGDTIESPGAAFRAKGEWYRLSYSCRTADDRMHVLSFRYRIGDKITEADWPKYNLWR